MPLAAIVESIDSVPEAFRSEYTEKDGKFHLNVEGLEDTGALKLTLQKERDARKALEKDVAAWKKLGKTPDEIAELTAAKEREAEEAAKKAGNFDAILKQHQDKWNAEKATLETELAAARGSERGAIIETSVMGALTKFKATPEGIDLLTERLGRRIKFETVDGKRQVHIMQADGETPMIGSGANGAATFDDLVKEAAKNYPSLFEGTGAGGGGKSPKSAGGTGKTITRADFEKLAPSERIATVKTHTIVD